MLSDSAAALVVGGVGETCSLSGLVLIPLGMLGILGDLESLAAIAAGLLLLLCQCSC